MASCHTHVGDAQDGDKGDVGFGMQRVETESKSEEMASASSSTRASATNEEPVAGPSNKAAEFHLDVFDSGSSSSLEDCCTADALFENNVFDDEDEQSGLRASKRQRRRKKLASASKKSKKGLKAGKRNKKSNNDSGHCNNDSGLCNNDDEVEPEESSTRALDEDEEASMIVAVANNDNDNAEPPESACPSETEDMDASSSGGQRAQLEQGPFDDRDDESNEDNSDNWAANENLATSSTTASAASPLNDGCDVDEIVRDHDNFGTHENEEDENSMDDFTVAQNDDGRLYEHDGDQQVMLEHFPLAGRRDQLCRTESLEESSKSSTTTSKTSAVSVSAARDVSLSASSSSPSLPFPSSSKRKSESIAHSSDVVVDSHTGVSDLKRPCLNISMKHPYDDGTTVIHKEDSRVDFSPECSTSPTPSSLSTVQETASSLTRSVGDLTSSIDGEENSEIAQWLTSFSRWSHSSKLSAIDQLIGLCQPSQVRHMMSVIEPQFQRDFILLLPKELSLYILSFLTPQDLLRAAQTCRYWRILCEDNLLWREKCVEAGLDQSISDVMRARLDKASSPAFAYSPYKASLLCQHNVEMNWRVKPIRSPKVLKGHEDHVITCLQFCNDKVVSGSDDNTLKVWSVISGKCLRTLMGHTGGVWSSQMEGNTVVSGSTDRTLKVWDSQTGDCVHTLYGHTSTVRCMHLHKSRVVSGSRDATLRMWDISSGECLHVLLGHVAAVRCVQYNGQLVVSGAYDYTVKVWNPEREECLHTLSGHTNRVYSLQFDGIHVVSGSLDTSIRVWDVQSGACKHALMGHQSLTSGMELRNNILVSGNADSTVKVWDITTGQCLQTLSGPNKHQSAVTCLQFNSKFVITSSDDGTVKLWDVNTGQFLRDLVSLESGGSGGVVWRIRANSTKLVCAVGSRNGTEETKLLVLDFEADTIPHIAAHNAF